MVNVANSEVEKLALGLPVMDKARLINKLLDSLDRPDKRTDALWKREVEDRIRAHKSGRMKAVPLAEVLARYGKRR